jgi:hypothetical protein
VNRAILQHCFFWFGNTGADVAIAILLPTLKRFSCNGAVDWSTNYFAVKAFHKKGDSFVIAQREFRREFGIHRNHVVLSAHAKKTWVRNFEATGSTLKKKGGSVKTVRTPENIAVVREAIGRSPHRSARRHTVSLRLSEASVRRILHKDRHFYPYKTHVTHALHERDYVNRVNFCQTFLQFEIHAERSQNYHRFVKRFHSKSTLCSSPRLHCN